MTLHTVLVAGPLALRLRRLESAREAAHGRQILTLRLLASRLAGGFIVPAGREVLFPAITKALAQGEFEDLGRVADLPGITRAVLKCLDGWWQADLSFDDYQTNPRLRDLALIESRVRGALPEGALAPPDLRTAALSRLSLAPRLLSRIVIDRIIDIAPVWRPLITALSAVLPIEWIAPPESARSWFKGPTVTLDRVSSGAPAAEVCADPRSEVMEALRWAREMLATGKVPAADIGIAATSTEAWDDHFLVLAREADIPLHFSHGIPALATREGQICAAFADVLLRGISQERIRRLLRRLPRTPARDSIPDDWAAKLPRGAALHTLDNWRHALEKARPHRRDGARAESALLQLLEMLAKGPAGANAAGALLLKGKSLELWEEALRAAPAQAVDLSLQAMRVADGQDPGNSVVWGPARHLAAMPRRCSRLLGLTGRSWPRAEDDDPVLPHRIISRRVLRPVSVTESDRRDFYVIAGQSETLVLSRSQRNAKGTLQARSALWPRGEIVKGRGRVPEHAYSESDRLFARSSDAIKVPQIRASRTCWWNWQDGEILSPHDGLIRAGHPVIETALAELQSNTSLQRLLCDPVGYVWESALGWKSLQFEIEPLALDPKAFGELVHALISGAVRDLHRRNGSVPASLTEVEQSLQKQAESIAESWPIARAVPPRLLWLHTVDEALRRGLRALTEKDVAAPDARSWTEILFGEVTSGGVVNAPWDMTVPVPIGDTGLAFRGRMDRLDVSVTGDAATITDYKSGGAPRKASSVVFGHGAELQRVFYALAVRTLLPEARRIVSRLMYLDDEPAGVFGLSDEGLNKAIDSAIGFVRSAAEVMRSGRVAPGPEQRFFDQMSLALPADSESYRKAKQRVFAQANSKLAKLWSSA